MHAHVQFITKPRWWLAWCIRQPSSQCTTLAVISILSYAKLSSPSTHSNLQSSPQESTSSCGRSNLMKGGFRKIFFWVQSNVTAKHVALAFVENAMTVERADCLYQIEALVRIASETPPARQAKLIELLLEIRRLAIFATGRTEYNSPLVKVKSTWANMK